MMVYPFLNMVEIDIRLGESLLSLDDAQIFLAHRGARGCLVRAAASELMGAPSLVALNTIIFRS